MKINKKYMLAALCVASGTANAAVTNLFVSNDTYNSLSAPGANFGSSNTLNINGLQTTYVSYNLSSLAGLMITNVQLFLPRTPAFGGGFVDVSTEVVMANMADILAGGGEFTTTYGNTVMGTNVNPSFLTSFAISELGGDQVLTLQLSGANGGINTQFGSRENLTIGGSFLQVTTVPEPAAAMLGAIGTLALLRRRRN